MKYKVTTRGWVVFSILGIIVIILLVSMLNNLTSDKVNSNVDSLSQVDNAEVEETSSDDSVNHEDTSDQPLIDEETSEDQTSSEDTSNQPLDEEATDVAETDKASENAVEDITDIDPITDYNKESIILFDKNVAELQESYMNELNEWVTLLKDNNLTITVEGHINGYPYYNDGDFGLSLAENRANIIKDFMVRQGIEDKRIFIVNMGSNKQADKTEKLFLNRRAIIYFNEKP